MYFCEKPCGLSKLITTRIPVDIIIYIYILLLLLMLFYVYTIRSRLIGACNSNILGFSLTWWEDHVGVQNNGKMSLKFCIIVESNSQDFFRYCSLHQHSRHDVTWKPRIFFIDRFIFRSNFPGMRLPWDCYDRSQETNWRQCTTVFL